MVEEQQQRIPAIDQFAHGQGALLHQCSAVMLPELVKIAAAGTAAVGYVKQIGRFGFFEYLGVLQGKKGREAVPFIGEALGELMPERASVSVVTVMMHGFRLLG
ncbi:MAG: hypothetical protein RBT64_03080 [Trichloromonas sp.]|jgi:hypothetical protein|nr:hypothetical protein [Trichloromonas sp.]